MGSMDKFCLRWKDFGDNVSSSFAGIRDNSQFFDVTLTTDDDEACADSLRAHRVILAACSEFFRNILAKESMRAHPNPLVYLKGISALDLKYVLDFMYHGEVRVAQEELDKFLEVAETLKIKGLVQNHGSRSGKRSAPTALPMAASSEEPFKKPKIHSVVIPSSPAQKAEGGVSIKPESVPAVDPIDTEEMEEGNGIIDCSDGNVEGLEDEYHSTDLSVAKFSDSGLSENTTGRKPYINSNDAQEPNSHKKKHLTATEKVTLVNLVRTLDKENIIRDGKRDDKDSRKRRALWEQIVPAFNEICGINCGLRKLQDGFRRIVQNQTQPAFSLLYE